MRMKEEAIATRSIEGEEDTTLSWSSSMNSLSPDNPPFTGKSKDMETRLPAWPIAEARSSSDIQGVVDQTMKRKSRSHDDLTSSANIENPPGASRTSEEKNFEDDGGFLLEMDNEDSEQGENAVILEVDDERVAQAVAPEQPLQQELLAAASVQRPQWRSYAGLLMPLPGNGELSSEVMDELHEKQQQIATEEYNLRPSASLVAFRQHHKMPSTILEESPSTLEADDKIGDESNRDDTHPLLRSSPGLSNISSPDRSVGSTKHIVAENQLDEPPVNIVSSVPSSPNLSMVRRTPLSPSGSLHPTLGPNSPPHRSTSPPTPPHSPSRTNGDFEPLYSTSFFYQAVFRRLMPQHCTPFAAATWIGFWALLHVTCANYVLTPMRDAIALQVGVEHVPKLTLASTVLAFCSSVPIGWLFEAPDPNRRRMFKRLGLTRGATQGTSLALFYRFFAFSLLSYAVGFQLIEMLRTNYTVAHFPFIDAVLARWPDLQNLWPLLGKIMYVAFFLVVHLMKLHSLSLVWGVTTEAMEYEEVARKQSGAPNTKTRLQRLGLVSFGGTVGGILGSGLASSMAQILHLPGLLVLAAILLEISAELSIELGRIMQKHWEGQQLFQSSNDLASLDTSMKRSTSLGSMKRVASGNSLNRARSSSELDSTAKTSLSTTTPRSGSPTAPEEANDDTFSQRLLRGVTTILRSRLLMSIFTYNALYASTNVLLSFQRAVLVANRQGETTVQADTAFLANVNMASSVAIFALQASGLGATLANVCGNRGTLALMPLIRLCGVLALAWWHHVSQGQPPNIWVFLIVDEWTKVINLAVAKPVRESLWRGLSNEARYEAKPIVDTLANRWGGGSAAFLVSFLNRTLDLLGVQEAHDGGGRNVLGFPPILFLCMIIAAWWTAVSADLGQIRSKIDLELKKRQ